MDIRKDLESVSSYITRLIAIGNEFSRNEASWSHLKNNEDFERVYQVEVPARYKLETVYADGRDMALYMRDALLSINHDFSRYPTLTSIIEGFAGTWVYGSYRTNLKEAERAYDQSGISLWSIRQMIELFREQERLLEAVRNTLYILKKSDLYKQENGLPVESESRGGINVSGVTGSSININSPEATASINIATAKPEVFGQMIDTIKSHGLPEEEEAQLIDNTQVLATSYETDKFLDGYKDFMQNVAAHITIFAPFIPALTSLI